MNDPSVRAEPPKRQHAGRAALHTSRATHAFRILHRHAVMSKYSIARGGRAAGNKHRGISPFSVPTSLNLHAVSLCT